MESSKFTSMESFFQNSTMFPTNVDIGILQVGRESDFMDECTYLKMAFDYLKKIEKKQDEFLNEENYQEFSNYINAPIGNKTRHQTEKLQLNQDFEKFNFADVGDTNPVIFPMISINRKFTDEKLLRELEERTEIHKNPEIRKKINKFTDMEREKEKKVLEILKKQYGEEKGEDFYNQHFLPDSRYYYIRALALYYFNSITPDEKKSNLKMTFNLLSYLNFHYPHGNLNGDITAKQTFEDIQNVVNYMDEIQAKTFLEKIQLDQETLTQKVQEEREQKYKCSETGLL